MYIYIFIYILKTIFWQQDVIKESFIKNDETLCLLFSIIIFQVF